MSAASTPIPRSSSSSSSRHSLFWPVLVLLFGVGTLAIYEVLDMEDQLATLTASVDKLDGKVKHAQHERSLLYALARDMLRLAPKDPNAQQIVTDFKLQQLTPALEGEPATTGPSPAPTNAPPLTDTTSTNAASSAK
jgi:hypothetical protein